jgi:hypothetical protein
VKEDKRALFLLCERLTIVVGWGMLGGYLFQYWTYVGLFLIFVSFIWGFCSLVLNDLDREEIRERRRLLKLQEEDEREAERLQKRFG